MDSNRLNRALIRIIGVGWAAFAIATVVVRTVFAAPDVTLLVDRSYCDPAKWSAIADQYESLYQQDQRGQIKLASVILFSDLGEETADVPPTPAEFRAIKTYGKSSRDRQAALEATYSDAILLQCEP